MVLHNIVVVFYIDFRERTGGERQTDIDQLLPARAPTGDQIATRN